MFQFGNIKHQSEYNRIISVIMNSLMSKNISYEILIGDEYVSIFLPQPKVIQLPKSDIYDINQYFLRDRSVIKIQFNYHVMQLDLEY